MRQSSTLALTIALTLLGAIVLAIVPMPDWLRPYRPEWVLLVLMYWSMALPASVGVGVAWSTGLLMDAIQGSLLGQHALGFAVTVYIVLHLYQRVRVFPLAQQAATVALLLVPYLGISHWVLGMSGHAPGTALYWAPLLSSALAWPLIFPVLRSLRRRAIRF
ncbi:MAG: rod shape-determining protein MreD [Gammaproteobacteria bacterium]|jgi:rod shape-determining protein MreD|nr:rod shape-determining protein MreD [Gammaproteobacteria bacterium]